MERKQPRIVIAAVGSGCGKTTVTCGLLRAWQRQGMQLKAWKCGPDYIDPMFHKHVLGIAGGNLDSYFVGREQLNRQLEEESRDCDLAVVEGVMGFYDGMGGTSTWASTYEVAAVTRTPVILLIDGKGCSLSAAAVLRGFLQFKENHQIAGVILNRTGTVMAERLRPFIEAEGVPLLGNVPNCTDMALESRHLGLVMPGEVEQIQEKIDRMAEVIRESVDMEKLYQIAVCAPPIVWKTEDVSIGGKEEQAGEAISIAVARDEAFCFYYQENLELLEHMGAVLVPFSPLKDKKLPNGVNGLILGGGYPENYGKQLSENRSMLFSIAAAIKEGIPLLAECGGFLYLHKELEDKNGDTYPMLGIIEEKAWRTGKLSRFGYVSLTPQQEDCCLKGEIRGHEFHYWESGDCGDDWMAEKPAGKRRWSCIHSSRYQIAGFPHLYYPSNPCFLRAWLEGCRKWKREVTL